MYALLKGLGVGRDGHVAIQAFTCLAVPEGVMATGARPQWIDVDADSVNMCPDSLAERITETTQAIVVQHTFGIPARMEPILAVAADRGIPVVEDCCHTMTSTIGGRTVGDLGVGAFYSFEWGKPMVAGIGGAARANTSELKAHLQNSYPEFRERGGIGQLKLELQYHGYRSLYRPSRYWQIRDLFHKLSSMGAAEGNYHPVDANAEETEDFKLKMASRVQSRLRLEMARFPERLENHRKLAAMYREGIRSSKLQHVASPKGSTTDYVRYPLLAEDKADLLARARAQKIELADWYSTPIHPLDEKDWAAIDFSLGQCPNAESMSKRIVTLPITRPTSESDVRRAIDFLNA